MARRISVEITGDATSLERSFKRAGHSASTFNRDVSKSFRGAAAGSGLFKSLGRSLAFASGGFLAFASAGEAIRKSIDAATEAAATQRQLAAQFRATGTNLSIYKGQIEDTTLSVSRLSGFQDDELLRSFITAFRGTKDVASGLKIQAAAANAARGTHKGLAVVTLGLTKAFLGQSAAVRRLGILIPKNLKGMAAITFVARKFAGQALAGTTAQERFGAALHNTEETIGGALLPSLNKYLNRATDWLDKTENQRKIQREMNSAVKSGTAVLQGFTDFVKQARGPLEGLAQALGGVRTSIRLLLEALVAKKLADMAIGFAGVGTAASGAAIEVSALRLALLRLSAIGTILVGIDLIINKKDRGKARQFIEGKAGSQQNKSLHDLIHVGQGVADAATQIAKGNVGHSGHTLGFNTEPRHRGPGPLAGATSGGAPREARTQRQRQLAASRAAERIQAATGHEKSTALGFKARFAKLELKLAQAELTETKTDDRKILVAEAALIRERLSRLKDTAKTLKERTDLTKQLGGIEGEIQSIDQEALDKRKAAVAKHLQAVRQKEQQLRQQISNITQQFSQALDTARSALGDLFQGPIMAPTEAQMKAKLGAGGADVKTLTKDLNAQVAQFARFQHDLAVLAKRGAPKQLLKELRAKGTEALPEIEALAKAKPGDLKAFFKAFGKGEKLVQHVARIDMKAALVTLRADKLQLAHLRGQGHHARRMAQGGIVRSPTFAMVGEAGPEAVIPLSQLGRRSDNGPQEFHVYIDGQPIEARVTARQQRKAKTMAPQVRGRHPGHILGTS